METITPGNSAGRRGAGGEHPLQTLMRLGEEERENYRQKQEVAHVSMKREEEKDQEVHSMSCRKLTSAAARRTRPGGWWRRSLSFPLLP